MIVNSGRGVAGKIFRGHGASDSDHDLSVWHPWGTSTAIKATWQEDGKGGTGNDSSGSFPTRRVVFSATVSTLQGHGASVY